MLDDDRLGLVAVERALRSVQSCCQVFLAQLADCFTEFQLFLGETSFLVHRTWSFRKNVP